MKDRFIYIIIKCLCLLIFIIHIILFPVIPIYWIIIGSQIDEDLINLEKNLIIKYIKDPSKFYIYK